MTAINGASLNSNWFVMRGNYGIVKDEYKGQLADALTKRQKQAADTLQSFLTENKTGNQTVQLTAQQKAELSAKYDPKNMSLEEYNNFIDDVCSYGIVPAEQKERVACSMLTPLEYAGSGAQVSGFNVSEGISYRLESRNNNVLNWVRYQASFEEFDPVSQSFKKSPSAQLFGKLEEVLNQMI